MDGINKRTKKRRLKKTTISRSFSDGNYRSLPINKPHSSYSEIRKVKKQKRGKYILNKTKKRQTKNTFSFTAFFNKIILLVKKKWFRFIFKIIVIFSILIFIINSFDRTKLMLRPHLEYIEINEPVIAKRIPKENELSFEVIAISDEISIPINASGTRPVEQYAQGTITLFNEYSSEPQRLLSETRFESASGKIFKLGNNEVIVPGKKENNPGTIQAVIYADKPGKNYNIDSTDFTIPGFKENNLNDKYNKLYASSNSSFSGGYIGSEPFITKEQRIYAVNDLQKQLYNRLILKLEKEKTDELIIINKSSRVDYREPISVFSDTQDLGIITGRGTIFALAIGKRQLENYIAKKNIESVADVLMLSSNNISIDYIGDEINFKDQKTLALHISGSALFSWVIDEESVTQSILGKEKKQLINIFESTKSIDKAFVKIRPFWKKRVSSEIEKISITLEK